MIEENEILTEFLNESQEALDKLDQDLVSLEKDPTATEILAGIFRSFHSIKGTCGFLGFSKLESLTHAAENLLSKLRDGSLKIKPVITTALLRVGDASRQTLATIAETGNEGQPDFVALIAELNALQRGELPSTTVESTPSTPDVGRVTPPADVAPPPPSPVAEPPAVLQHDDEPAHASLNSDHAGDAENFLASGPGEGRHGVPGGTIRVDVGLLDRLMNLVGELVLARNQVLQFNVTQQDPTFATTSQRLDLITTELQEGVMKTRMQPIGNIWNKFPRVVRDLAQACQKSVRIEMEGKETELDKTIIEAIKDPLTHIVRNSVDHGIETPEARVAAGKPAQGLLMLRAFHEGGQVNIEISDDGAGVNLERVRRKAVERGLINSDQAARLTEREVLNLLFLPGFSTAEKVTNVSGRGVGMDVVKTNIEKIGGTLDIHSKAGSGTTIKIKIPLTLAIIPALMVNCGGDRYAIPQVSLLELVALEGEQARKSIEHIHGAPVYRLRGNLLPLVYLNSELRVEAAHQAHDWDVVNIVVLQADERQFGLVVEGISDTEEIVVKPLGKQLKGISVFAGATIMGDGKVALILDVLGIAQHANVVTGTRDRNIVDKSLSVQEVTTEKQTFLLLSSSDGCRMAIPLALVSRLEEFDLNSVERAGSKEVVQYRNQILPLIRLSEALGKANPTSDGQPLSVVVHNAGGRSVGIVVDEILDIVEEAPNISAQSNKDGILGSAVLQQRVTDILDVNGIIRLVEPGFFNAAHTEAQELINV